MALDRDAGMSDAVMTDLYLDALLAGVVVDASATGRTPNGVAGELDPAARRTADRLRHDLVRVHPSFRFEDRLATRLAEAAAAMRIQAAAGGGRIVSFRSSPPVDSDLFRADLGPVPAGPLGVDDDPPAPGPADPGSLFEAARRSPGRPLLIGGALTSAALSLAGAAFVAWRLARPGRGATPMARAARAVRDARLQAALATVGLGGPSRPRRLD